MYLGSAHIKSVFECLSVFEKKKSRLFRMDFFATIFTFNLSSNILK